MAQQAVVEVVEGLAGSKVEGMVKQGCRMVDEENNVLVEVDDILGLQWYRQMKMRKSLTSFDGSL